jgi:hypothetical protein
MVGWHATAGAPDRFRTWTAVSVPHPAAMAWALASDSEQRERSAYIGFFRKEGTAEDALLDDDARALRAIFAGSGLDAAGVDRYVAPLLVPGALTAALKWYRATDPREIALGTVRVPTSYVWSDEDVAIAPTAAHRCGRHVAADYRLTTLQGVSHWISDQTPDLLADVIVRRALQPA